jgi:hypothetical protein
MSLNFNSKEEYILEDEHVLLRPLRTDDVKNLLSIAVNEPETWKYSSKNAGSEALLTQYINEAVDLRTTGL